MKRARLTALLLALMFSLGACGGDETLEQTSEETGGTETTESPVSFPVDAAVPLALVDLNGYETGGEKTVLFRSDAIGETFELRSVTDDSVVYTGAVRATGGGMSYGRFTEFQTGGTYYVFNETIGTSYAFRIGADIYAELLAGSLSQFYSAARETEESGSGDTTVLCDALRDLLLAYEMYPARFADGGDTAGENDIPDVLEEARRAVEWLLQMQDAGGAFHAGDLPGEEDSNAGLTLRETTPEVTICAAGVLARFAYVYGAHDTVYAEEVLSRAEQAWDSYTAVRTPLQDPAAFAAAAELYRITGDRRYEMVLAGFFPREDFGTLLAENTEILYGSATYLETQQPVNPEVCNAIRTHMTADAAEIAEGAQQADYLVRAQDADKVLSDALRLCVMNHFIFRQERVGVMENHLHYLCGRNPEATDYITESSENSWKRTGAEPLFASLPRTARLVLLLAAL
ncbi:MAG: glycoside hydrolase family 9 protein [Lachnospiraceae bacterium]|nr:glycoside hydrolase family 9 protein [Lachnospiraceae bacterium]